MVVSIKMGVPPLRPFPGALAPTPLLVSAHKDRYTVQTYSGYERGEAPCTAPVSAYYSPS